MTYRDDHDAALARIHALEAENKRLERENKHLRDDRLPPDPERRRGVLFKLAVAVAIAIPTLGLAFGSVFAVRMCTP